MSVIQYSLNDYNTVLCDTFKSAKQPDYTAYKLPEEVVQIISNLSKKFGVSIASHSNSAPSSNKKHVKNLHIEQSWIPRDFKPTMVVEKKDGIDKIMNDVRVCLNKISNKNYDTIRDTIITKIKELLDQSSDDTNTDGLQKIANNIFEIASTNKFFSEIYAKLYRELTEQFPEIFNQIVNTFLTGFTETMRNIKYVDQNINYDEFCKYNKENDKRKATSVFITNLIKENVVDVEVLVSLIVKIQGILDEYMNTPNKINEVEEITENIFLLFTNDMHLLQKPNTIHLFDKIQTLASMKPKELPSISSRAIFKYMDILEKFQKISAESSRN